MAAENISDQNGRSFEYSIVTEFAKQPDVSLSSGRRFDPYWFHHLIIKHLQRILQVLFLFFARVLHDKKIPEQPENTPGSLQEMNSKIIKQATFQSLLLFFSQQRNLLLP